MRLTCRVMAFISRQVGVPLVHALFEVVQGLFGPPAGVPLLLPVVEVPFVAADVEHRVEDGAAAEDLPPGPAASLVLHRLARALLRLGPESFVNAFTLRPFAEKLPRGFATTGYVRQSAARYVALPTLRSISGG